MKGKRRSKNNKSSWRKFISDVDVNAYLDDKRLDERLGTPFELRDDASIFKLDNDSPALISCSSSVAETINVSSLKCLRGLINTSAVPDPLIKRNNIRTKVQRQHPILKKKNEILLRKGILKKREIVELQGYFQKHVACFEQKQRRRITVDKDTWGYDTDIKPKVLKFKNWFTSTTYLHTVRNTSDLKEMSNFRFNPGNTIIPSIEIPHPGISYNPAFKDHLDLTNEVVQTEIDTQKVEKHLDRVTQNLFKRISIEEKEKNWFEEMSEGLPFYNESDNKNTQDDHSDFECYYKAVNSPVSRQMKKTTKQRKKQQRVREEELKQKKIKEQKKKVRDICRIKYIVNEIMNEEMKTVSKSLKKHQSKQKYEIPRRISKNTLKNENLHIAQIADLTGTLREIIPQGNIMSDRFMNMQKRSLIEVSKPQFKNKRKKKKKYRLASHRSEPVE